MAIAFLQPLSAGNAVRVFIDPPPSAKSWRVLRKTADAFTGAVDSSAVVVCNGNDATVLDLTALVNGTLYFYHLFAFNGSSWSDQGPSSSVTPAATFGPAEVVDTQALVRERFDLGLQACLVQGMFTHPKGHIEVLTAPPRMDSTDFPVVTLHLSSDSSAVRGLGEETGSSGVVSEATWNGHQGWLARIQLEIGAWALNADQRIALRKSIKAVVAANLPIFYDQGLLDIDLTMSDFEDFQSENAPLYGIKGTFTCQAPVSVQSETASLAGSVELAATIS